MDDNLVVNPNFLGNGEAPEGWTFITPRAEIAPHHRFVPASEAGDDRLIDDLAEAMRKAQGRPLFGVKAKE